MNKNTLPLTLSLLLFGACDSGPKTIPTDGPDQHESGSTGVFSNDGKAPTQAVPGSSSGIEQDLHTVVALEVLPTERYVYVRVKEGADEFWIASDKTEVIVGRPYFYRGGLLKTNFHSNEYNRDFDELVLVSKVVPADHGESGMADASPTTVNSQEVKPTVKVDVAGSVKIADLIASPKKYEGKVIQVSGTCTKVNPNIMGRNWVHLKDGSKGDPEVVATTDVVVPLGEKATIVGTVVLDKDFGAGYRYAILLENATTVH
ncbi:MAG: hypothetical protein IPO60_10870 [Flavobacteriales bacterium]|nr:hypothetical protein [Flavobacteriales bacterium]MBK7246088.1 hypothetical protein [Flavobacteriales bacterium]MBK9598795.1 hypothetical protein [Flavobacteriales bacterium]QQS71794.1 MAG: hypothetical protein IPP95_11445 [Flavobacteriales bacterium]HQV39749.1 hypothetical protein [Flavobacteriales bacterium]